MSTRRRSRAPSRRSRRSSAYGFSSAPPARALTEAGSQYFARVSPLIEELDRTQDEVVAARVEPSGPLRLTASVAFGEVCLTPLLPALSAAFPRLQFELL